MYMKLAEADAYNVQSGLVDFRSCSSSLKLDVVSGREQYGESWTLDAYSKFLIICLKNAWQFDTFTEV